MYSVGSLFSIKWDKHICLQCMYASHVIISKLTSEKNLKEVFQKDTVTM